MSINFIPDYIRMAEAIKIAIRVRPFNPKELEQNQKLCVEMVS